MLLLYRFHRQSVKGSFAQFTFHYASTLSKKVNPNSFVTCIYIPLCFYFIAVFVIITATSSLTFTFHYASTLSSPGHPVFVPCFSFTFHYASTLSKKDTWSFCFKEIYIPLCFYFIDEMMVTMLLNADLHSTMLLLYHCRYMSRKQRENNLHSTMLLLYPGWNHHTAPMHLIYIPLCFYFIEGDRWLKRTFHRFTFHYASTLSNPVQPEKSRWPYLHSTMLLLYRFD